ncbi:MAG: multidrug effflux MFS transporter [Leucobacter sp.]
MRIDHPNRLTPGLLTVLGFVAAASSLATDLYLPSLPSISNDLHAAPSLAQVTLSVFFFGIGAGQLLLGALSDSRGRRSVLLIALTVFALSGIAMSFSPGIEMLIALRLVQGFAGAAGLVLSRAIVADLSEGETAVRALSLIVMVSGLGPLLAPAIGGLTQEWWGWRGSLAALGVIGAIMLVLAWLVIPESLPPAQRTESGFRATFAPFGRLLRDGRFVALAVAFGLGFGTIMAYISASPFVGQKILGMSPFVYALSFSAAASAMLIANLVNARIAPRVGPRRMLTVSVVLLCAGSFSMLALVTTGTLTIAGLIACAFAASAGGGLMISNASALALARADYARGSGSALIGAIQFLFGGLVAPLTGLWGEETALPMAVMMAVGATLAALCAFLALRPEARDGA